MSFEREELEEAPDWAIREYARMQENILVNIKWLLIGMPAEDVLRERYSPPPVFTDAEEQRIREIARIVKDELEEGSG